MPKYNIHDASHNMGWVANNCQAILFCFSDLVDCFRIQQSPFSLFQVKLPEFICDSISIQASINI